MTALAGGGNGYPNLKFAGIGSSIEGTVIEAVDIQERDFNSKAPKFFPDGSPIMQVRVVLEQPGGNRGNLYISGKAMKQAVRAAIQAAGASDIDVQDYLKVTRTGGLGQAGNPYTYSAEVVSFDPADMP